MALEASTRSASVTLSQFNRVALVIGRAMHVSANDSAKIPAYLIKLYFGDALTEEHKKISKKDFYMSSAQLCSNHKIEDFTRRLLLCVVNFPRKQIGKIMSDCLVTGVQKDLSNPDEKRKTTVFMQPSCPVQAGAKVTLLGQEEVYLTNPRDLKSWEEFSCLDLRIGTILSYKSITPSSDEEKKSELHSTQMKIKLLIDLGSLGQKEGVGMIDADLEFKSLLNRQALVLTNLSKDEIERCFQESKPTVVLCTIAGRAILEPGLPVENGYKLA